VVVEGLALSDRESEKLFSSATYYLGFEDTARVG